MRILSASHLAANPAASRKTRLDFLYRIVSEWRRNLTFELGMRYDWNITPTERYDRFIVFDQTDRIAHSRR